MFKNLGGIFLTNLCILFKTHFFDDDTIVFRSRTTTTMMNNTQLTFALKLKDSQRSSDKPKKKRTAKAKELDAAKDAASAEHDAVLMFAMDL